MPKALLRLIVFLLVPCLLTDPALASAFCQGSCFTRTAIPVLQPVYGQQALSERSASVPYRPNPHFQPLGLFEKLRTFGHRVVIAPVYESFGRQPLRIALAAGTLAISHFWPDLFQGLGTLSGMASGIMLAMAMGGLDLGPPAPNPIESHETKPTTVEAVWTAAAQLMHMIIRERYSEDSPRLRNSFQEQPHSVLSVIGRMLEDPEETYRFLFTQDEGIVWPHLNPEAIRVSAIKALDVLASEPRAEAANLLYGRWVLGVAEFCSHWWSYKEIALQTLLSVLKSERNTSQLFPEYWEKIREAVVQALREDQNSYWLIQGIEELSHWTSDPVVARLLHDLTSDPRPAVQQAAQNALTETEYIPVWASLPVAASGPPHLKRKTPLGWGEKTENSEPWALPLGRRGRNEQSPLPHMRKYISARVVSKREGHELDLDVVLQTLRARRVPGLPDSPQIIFSAQSRWAYPDVEFVLIAGPSADAPGPHKGIGLVLDHQTHLVTSSVRLHWKRGPDGKIELFGTQPDSFEAGAFIALGITVSILAGFVTAFRESSTSELQNEILTSLAADPRLVFQSQGAVYIFTRNPMLPLSPNEDWKDNFQESNARKIALFNAKPGYKMVEFGSGLRLDFVAQYQQRYPGRAVLAFDTFAAEFQDEEAERFKQFVSDTLVIQNAHHTGLDPDSVDEIYIHMPHPRENAASLLHEAHRILKPGGRVVITTEDDSRGTYQWTLILIRESLSLHQFRMDQNGVLLKESDLRSFRTHTMRFLTGDFPWKRQGQDDARFVVKVFSAYKPVDEANVKTRAKSTDGLQAWPVQIRQKILSVSLALIIPVGLAAAFRQFSEILPTLHLSPMYTPLDDPYTHPFIYFAGDPDNDLRRDELTYEGVLQGLRESGLSAEVQRDIEIKLWSAYTRRHAEAAGRAIDYFRAQASFTASAQGASQVEPWLTSNNLLFQQKLAAARAASDPNQKERLAKYLQARFSHRRLLELATQRLARLNSPGAPSAEGRSSPGLRAGASLNHPILVVDNEPPRLNASMSSSPPGSLIERYFSIVFSRLGDQWHWEGFTPEQIQSLLDHMTRIPWTWESQKNLGSHQDGVINLHPNFLYPVQALPSQAEKYKNAVFGLLVNDVIFHEVRHFLLFLLRQSQTDPHDRRFRYLEAVLGKPPISADEEEQAVLAYQEAYYFDHPIEAMNLMNALATVPHSFIGPLDVPGSFLVLLDRAFKGEQAPTGPVFTSSEAYRERVLQDIEQADATSQPEAFLLTRLRRVRRILAEADASELRRAVRGLLRIIPTGTNGIFVEDVYRILKALCAPDLKISPEEAAELFNQLKRHVPAANPLGFFPNVPSPSRLDSPRIRETLNSVGPLITSASYISFDVLKAMSRLVSSLMTYPSMRPLLRSIVQTICRRAYSDLDIFQNVLPFARDFMASTDAVDPEIYPAAGAAIAWMMKTALFFAPEPLAWNRLLGQVFQELPPGERRTIQNSYKRFFSASLRHAQGDLVPESVKKLFARLPTLGSRQAGLIACYLYANGGLSQGDLERELRQLEAWEREARKRFGPDFLVAQEFHSENPDWSPQSHVVQALLELMMRVEENVSQQGKLIISTIFEDSGLEFQSLPSASGEVQARLWDLWEDLAALEGFNLYGSPDRQKPSGYWLHFNVNGKLQGPHAKRLLLMWARENAKLMRDLGLPADLGTSSQYVHWDVRPPRRSRLGGVRTEITGTLWMGTVKGRRDPRLRAYRKNLLMALTETSWAYQNRDNDSQARALWEERVKDLPPTRALKDPAPLVATQLFLGLQAGQKKDLIYSRRTWRLYDLLVSWISWIARHNDAEKAISEIEDAQVRAIRRNALQGVIHDQPLQIYGYLSSIELAAQASLRVMNVFAVEPGDYLDGTFARAWLPVLLKSIQAEESRIKPVKTNEPQEGITSVLASWPVGAGAFVSFWAVALHVPYFIGISLAFAAGTVVFLLQQCRLIRIKQAPFPRIAASA